MIPAAPATMSGNFAWALGGTGVYLACQWAMVVVLARAGSPEKVGQFALGLAVTAPVVLFLNLGLRRLLATDAGGRFRFADLFGFRILLAAAAVVAIGFFAGVGGHSAETARVIVLVGVAKGVESASDLVYGLFQREERMRSIAVSQSLRGILGLAGLAAGLAATGGVAPAVVGMAAGWAVVFFLHDLPLAAEALPGESVRPRLEPARWGPLLRLGLPLGAVALLGALVASIPCFVIGRRLGEASLGIYTAIASFHAAGNRGVSALGEAASARLARHHAGGDAAGFVRVMVRMLIAAAGISAVGILIAWTAGRPALRLFFGAPYAERSDLLAGLLTVSLLVNVQTVLDYAMTAARRIALQPFLWSAAALLQAAFCLAWIPRYGLWGAVFSLAGISAIQTAAALAVLGHALSARAVLRGT